MSAGLGEPVKPSRGTFLAAALAAAFLAPAAARAEERVAEIGQTYQGRIEAGDDTYPSGEFVDFFSLEGRAGEEITVVMSSPEVDAYLGGPFPDGTAPPSRS